jgi:hypothetical protein
MELLIIAGIGLYLIYRFWKMIVKWLIILFINENKTKRVNTNLC